MMYHDPLHILLADDDEDDRLFFTDAFRELKITTIVETVNDGVQLMEYLNQQVILLPHMLFLDLNMPRKGGLECLQEIRSSEKLKDLCVAIYSTSSSEKDVEDTFVRGANIYIKKPSDFSSLKRVLGEVVTINWQYHTSGLNKETFMLSI